jgi:short-subunit dehydrogenase
VLCPPDTDTPGFEVENRNKPQETQAVSESGGLMQPRDVAAAVLKGMSKGKFFIGPGSAKMVFRLKRFFPWLVELVMERDIRKAQKSR